MRARSVPSIAEEDRLPQLAYLKVQGIKGPAAFEKDPYNRQGTIPIRAVDHPILVDPDPKTGKPTKAAKHGPLVVRKNIDSASPHLREMHVTGDERDCNLFFFHMPRSGPETLYLTLTVSKARIVSFKTFMPHLAEPGMGIVHEWEEIGLVYESINWEYSKHESDPPPGLNPGIKNTSMKVNETVEGYGPDWVAEEAKARLYKALGMLTEKAADALLDEYRKANPGELPE